MPKTGVEILYLKLRSHRLVNIPKIVVETLKSRVEVYNVIVETLITGAKIPDTRVMIPDTGFVITMIGHLIFKTPFKIPKTMSRDSRLDSRYPMLVLRYLIL